MKKSLRVLLIEANQDDRQQIGELLLASDLFTTDISEAISLKEAISFLKRTAFDVVLLDLELPDSEQFHALEAIKKNAPDIPIIILISSQDKNIIETTLNHGAQDIYIKDAPETNMLSKSLLYTIEHKELEKNHKKYASLSNPHMEATFTQSIDGIIDSWSKEATQLYGYSEVEAIHQNSSILIPPDKKNEWDIILTAIRHGKTISRLETSRVHKDNQIINVSTSITPLINNANQSIGSSVTCFDISQEKFSELQLNIQLQVAIILAEAPDLLIAIQRILPTLCQAIEVSTGEMWNVNTNTNTLDCISSWSTLSSPEAALSADHHPTLQLGEDAAGIVWKTRAVYWLENIDQSSPSIQNKHFIKTHQLKSCFGFPIISAGEVLGVLLFYSRFIYHPNKMSLLMFTAISNQISSYMKHKRVEGNLLYLSQHDSLTTLANRSLFEYDLNQALKDAKYHRTKVAVLSLDLDQFKKINDTFGHASGDQLLLTIAKRLQSLVRATDTIARFGGDEFVILISKMKNIDYVAVLAEKIISSMTHPFIINGQEFFLTASMGIAIYPDDGIDASSILKNADIAMYYAKSQGKNNFQTCNKDAALLIKNKLELESALHHAVERNEFILHYQPINDIDTNDIIGAEALIRWQHPAGKLILPEEFLPLARENSFLLSAITNWTLTQACAQNKIWQKWGYKSISVNISAQQLTNDLILTVKNLLKDKDLAPHFITLEITEEALLPSSNNNQLILNSLKNLGVNIAIDDFGIGYSSLNYIKNFDIDRLKIDKSFIAGLPDDVNSIAIVSAIIAMAKALDIVVIAEGVETKAQFELLKHLGCDEYQGFYFSEPLPPQNFTELLKNAP